MFELKAYPPMSMDHGVSAGVGEVGYDGPTGNGTPNSTTAF